MRPNISSETQKLNISETPRQKYLRDQAYEKLSRRGVIIPSAVKKFVYGLAIAGALFGPDGGIDSVRATKILPRETIEDIQEYVQRTGNDVVEWVRENGIPAAKRGYEVSADFVSDTVATATPIIKEAASNAKNEVTPIVQSAVQNVYDYVLPSSKPTEVIRNTDVSNKTIVLDVRDIQDLDKTVIQEVRPSESSNETDPDKAPTTNPAEFGSEPQEIPQLVENPLISAEHPMDYKVSDEVFSSYGVTIEDLLAPTPADPRFKYFDALTNHNVPTLSIFKEGVMDWKDIIEQECAEFNSNPKNKGFEVSPNFLMAVMSIETSNTGSNESRSWVGATSAYQIMPEQFHKWFIKTGVWDGGVGRKLSVSEFINKLQTDKHYATKVAIKFVSDMKRDNQGKYEELGLVYPYQQLAFELAEYNGGQGNALRMFEGKEIPQETWDYVRMGLRIAIVAEGANDLRELYPQDYNKLLSSEYAMSRFEQAHKEEAQKRGKGKVYSTDSILKVSADPRFSPGVKTRELFLSEIETVTPSIRKVSAAELKYEYKSNIAIDAINVFEYR